MGTGGADSGRSRARLRHLVLSPSRISLHRDTATQSLPIAPPRPGRAIWRASAGQWGGFKAYLPGVACSGATEPSLTLECHPSDEAWPLDAGSHGVLLANFAPGRNHFDGRVSTANGIRKTLAPFFSAASTEENGRQYWLLAMLDGRTQIFDAAFDPVAASRPGAANLAATEAHCGAGWQTLATKAGEAREPDALRAFGLANRTPVPLSAPLDLPGPVTALWSIGGNSAVACGRRSRYRALPGIHDYGELRWIRRRWGCPSAKPLPDGRALSGVAEPIRAATVRS